MKYSFLTPLLAFASLVVALPARANIFNQQPVPDNRIVAVAAPYNEGLHQLLVIQQVNDDQRCWQESAVSAGPIKVDPLLAYFDFTGICGRSTDSNGYSIRLAGQDLDWRYGLQVVKQDNDLLLMGMPTGNKDSPKLAIGRVGGWDTGFVKIHLNPGWRMTQRTYQGEALGHVYFTHDQPLAAFKQQAEETEAIVENTGNNSDTDVSKAATRQPYGMVNNVSRTSRVIVPVGE